MSAETLIDRLRAFAAGCRGSMWQSRDETIRLCDEAANLIEALHPPQPDALPGDLRERVARLVDPEAFDHPTVHPQHLTKRLAVAYASTDAILALIQTERAG